MLAMHPTKKKGDLEACWYLMMDVTQSVWAEQQRKHAEPKRSTEIRMKPIWDSSWELKFIKKITNILLSKSLSGLSNFPEVTSRQWKKWWGMWHRQALRQGQATYLFCHWLDSLFSHWDWGYSFLKLVWMAHQAQFNHHRSPQRLTGQ